MTDCSKMYIRYISGALLVVNFVAGLQYLMLMHLSLRIELFAFPTIVGLGFGYLLGKNRAISRALEIQATTDPLTHLCNRRFLNTTLDLELARSSRYQSVFSVILFDVDNFKKINDHYGHLVGDEVLVGIARLLRQHCRQSDILARWGGEEFLVLLPNTHSLEAQDKAEELRLAIRTFSFDQVGQITCSFGVAALNLAQEETCYQITNRADLALYEAKTHGKDQVRVAS